MNGVLLIDKPQDITSHDVVALVRKRFKIKKVGHAGTLDPAATGLLVLLLGQATKKSNTFLNAAKAYHVECRLGIATDTDDREGKEIENHPLDKLAAELSKEKISKTIKTFQGEILQAVPRYSAVKINGKKLYELARQGKEFALPERLVNIYNIDIEKIELPYVVMAVKCSKGTYIRSLCRDIGKKLNCGGCVWQLRRTMSEPFDIKRAIKLDQLKGMTEEELLREIIKL
ncbi:MAG: tRNA pseudouridine(55) synthase TruB [Candidatus Kappaea frigidicola]|nr:tRNA pseudouridine(55) synthase TruB [Candidatus Kappaea frigidicola]